MASPGWGSPNRGCFVHSAKGPVSRILSCAVIPLGAASPRTLISDLPGGFGNCSSRLAASGRCVAPPDSWRALPSLFGLAPCGVYPASGVTVGAVRSYRTISPLPRHRARSPNKLRRTGPGSPSKTRGSRGGIFSVALAVREPSSSRPGRYPAHCPAEFGLSSPGSRASSHRQRPPGPPAIPILPRNGLARRRASQPALRVYNQR